MIINESNIEQYFIKKENLYLLDCAKCEDEFSFDFALDNLNILLINIKDNQQINLNLLENINLELSVLAENPLNTFKITANLAKNAHILCYFADFIIGKCKGLVAVNLNENNATCEWHLASLASKKDNKEFDVSVYHKASNTIAQMDNYGVCKDEGKLIFSGVSEIIKHAIKSKTRQNAKIMVFDKLSNGVAKPILKIDENDIEASHGAVVGKINDEHLFYLTSRGLTETEAKELITFGYLKPILKGFVLEEMRNHIEQLIEGRM